MPILVTGATGTVGSRLVPQLLDHGLAVRALVRDPSRARLDPRVELAVGDFESTPSLEAALEGVERAFLLTAGPQSATHDARFVAAAQKHFVKHIVKLSVLDADADTPVALGRWHRDGERAIEDSGIAWTFLRPGAFSSNALEWASSIRRDQRVYAPLADLRAARIDPDDIAAVARVALTEPGHAHRAYALSGPEALSTREQVAILSEVLGVPLECVDVPPHVVRGFMVSAGLPDALADAILESVATAGRAPADTVFDTVERLTGRAPRTFRAWCEAHRAAFAR